MDSCLIEQRRMPLVADIGIVEKLEEISLEDNIPLSLDDTDLSSVDSTGDDLDIADKPDENEETENIIEKLTEGNGETEKNTAEATSTFESLSPETVVTDEEVQETQNGMSVSEAFTKLFNGDIDAQTEAQAYDAIRWIPFVGDAYSLGRAAYFAYDGDTTEAGLCAVNVVPVVGNVISTAKRIKDAKDMEQDPEKKMEKEQHLPPMYKKFMSWLDDLTEDGNNEAVASGISANGSNNVRHSPATAIGGSPYVRYY